MHCCRDCCRRVVLGRFCGLYHRGTRQNLIREGERLREATVQAQHAVVEAQHGVEEAQHALQEFNTERSNVRREHHAIPFSDAGYLPVPQRVNPQHAILPLSPPPPTSSTAFSVSQSSLSPPGFAKLLYSFPRIYTLF